MALVDSEYRFLFCDIGCNGKVSDGGVFKETSLYKALNDKSLKVPHQPTFLVTMSLH